MNIKKCVMCGGLFVPLNSFSSKKVCLNCKDKEEEEFNKVKEYLLEKPSSGISDVSNATGIEEKKIIEYLKEGRLETTTENCLLNCEKCNIPIRSGKYCVKCISDLSKNITSICNKKEKEEEISSILTKIQLRKNR